MTLNEVQELWEVENPDGDFWEYVELPDNLEKDVLVDYLRFEYGDLNTIESNTGHFRNRIKMFFKTHKWNIEKLAASLEFKYNPIEDTKWHEYYDHSDDKTTDFNSNRDISTNKSTDFTEDVSTGRTDNIDTTFHETDVTDSKEVVEDEWSEHDKIDNEKVNYVSAFNLPESPSGSTFNDSEHHRDTEKGTIDKNGDDDKTTKTDTTVNKDSTTNTKETYSNEEETDSNEQVESVTDDDVVSQEVMDDDIHRDTYHHGNDRHSFQSLIEEERKQAQFNIYKWIGRHFSLEMLVCIW